MSLNYQVSEPDGKPSTRENESSEKFITNDRNQKLFARYWGDDAGITSPRGIVFIAHGACEHCLWYNQLAGELSLKDLYVFAHDHVGHGQSDGDRMHIDDFDFYVQDVFQHFQSIQKKFPGVPCFIIGHSMGGAIAIKAALDKPDFFKGVVLIGPAIIPSPDTLQPWKITVGRFLARVCPQAPMVKLNPEHSCRDPEVVQKYIDDPLNYHGSLKAKWGLCMINTLQYIEDHLTDITWPYLNLHGNKDKMTAVEGSQKMHEYSKSTDKTLKVYEGYYHQLHNEPGDDGVGVRREIVQWIQARV